MTVQLSNRPANPRRDDCRTRHPGPSVSFRLRFRATDALCDDDMRFRPVANCEHRGTVGADPAHRFPRDVAGRVEVLSMEAAVQAQRLAARGGSIESEDRELDAPWDEALDVQHVQ